MLGSSPQSTASRVPGWLATCLLLLGFLLLASHASAETNVTGRISSTTWTAANSPYHVVGTVTVNGVLSIEPGVTVLFDPGTQLKLGDAGAAGITGSLNAQGSAEQPILFTAYNGAVGGWGGMTFVPQNSASSTIRHAIVEKAGTLLYTSDRATLTLQHVTLQNSSGQALSGYGGSATIRSSTIRDHPGGIAYPVTSSLALTDVTIHNSSATPVSGGFAQSFTNVTVDGQPPAEIRVVGGRAYGPNVATTPIPYNVTATVTVSGTMTVQPGVTLRFAPGVALRLGDAGAAGITGALNVLGTAAQPVLFTSSNGVAGGWGGISFQPQNSAGSTIRNATIEKASTTLNVNAPASLTLVDVVLQNATGSAITSSASVTMRSSAVRDHASGLNFGITSSLSMTDVAIHDSGATPVVGGFAQSFTNVTIDGQPPAEIRVVGGRAYGPNVATAPIPYNVTATVTVSGTMTVQPGVTLRFAPGVALWVGDAGAAGITGALNVLGSAEQPVLFTSSNGVAGGWGGISFRPQNSAASTLRHATVEKASTAVQVLAPASLTLDNATLQNNTVHAASSGSAAVTVKSSSVRNNAGGFAFDITSSLTLQDVNVTNSGATPIAGSFAQFFTNVTIDGQPPAEIRVVGGRAYSPNVATTPLPYNVTATVVVSGTMTVQPGVTLGFAPGVVLQAGDAGAYRITGALNVLGTAAQPVLFTSSNGAIGGWGGVRFQSENTATSLLRHVTLEKAGTAITTGYATTRLTLDNATLQDDATQDVSCTAGTVTVHRTVLRGSPRGVTLAGCASFSARDSAFLDHAVYALSANQTQVADATINYWDAADGPSGIGPGNGTAVWGNVLFDPHIVDVPSAPTGLVATAGLSDVRLAWDAPTSVGTIFWYEIHRGTSPDGSDATLLATTPDGRTSHTDRDGLVPGLTYYYKVRGVNIVGPGAFSDGAGAAALHSVGSNAIVPHDEALHDVEPGAQSQNVTSLVSLTNLDAGGLICDAAGSPPGTPGAQAACVDARHTAGGEYDGDLTTWTNYYNRIAPVSSTCELVGVEPQNRPPSHATFLLDAPRVVDFAQMSTRGMPGLGNYDKMCAALYLQDADTGAWERVLLRSGYSGPSEVYADAASFSPRTITAVRIVAEWNQLVSSNPPGGWMGVNVLDVQVPAVGVRLTHPAHGGSYDANVAGGHATTATAETGGSGWERVEFRLGSATGTILGTSGAAPWQADVTIPVGTRTLCAVAVHEAGRTSTACNVFTVHPTAPGAPSDLQAAPGETAGTASLSWSAATPAPGHDVAGYRVYRGPASGGPYAPVGSTAGLTYNDTDLATGTHHYVVRAFTAANVEGPASDEANATVAGVTLPDGFTLDDYRPESPTGNTPFGGLAVKPTFPGGGGGGPTVNLANGEFVATFPLLHAPGHLGGDFAFALTFRSIGNAGGNATLGWRWDANWLQSLQPDGEGYVLRTGDGRLLPFAPVADGWEGPAGSYTKLFASGDVLELRDRDGNRRVFDPAKGHALTDAYDASGNRWVLAYGDSLELRSITDPTGRVVTLGYDATGDGRLLLASVTDWAGRQATLERDAGGRIVALRTPGPTAGTSHATRFELDAGGRIAAIRDPLHQEYVRIDYDALGRVLAQRAAGGAGAYFQHHHDAGVAFERDGEGNKVEWRFLHEGDSVPRVVPSAKVEHARGLRATDPASYLTTYAYNAQDEPTRVTLPAGNLVTYAYDEAAASFFARGNLLTQTRSPGSVPTPPHQATSQETITIRYAYDPVCHKPTTIVDPRGTDPTFVPPNGGTASASRYATTIAYDAACRPVSIEKPKVNPEGVPHPLLTSAYANQTIRETYAYNDAGQILAHTDASGVVETRTYYPAPSSPGKPAGHLATITRDAGGLALTTTYEYAEFGVASRIVDARGNASTYAVDLRGRTTERTGPDVGSPPAGIRTRWTYDANDQLVLLERQAGSSSTTFATTAYAYDALGRLVSETSHPTATHAITVRYAYDANGNLVQRTGGAGETQTSTYDERGLLLTKSGPEGGTYAYDANGNLRTSVDPLGRVTTYQHDGYDRLAVVTNAQQSRFVTSYDPADNVVVERGLGGTSGRILHERQHDHDEAGRAYEQREWLQSADTMPSWTGTLGAGGRWVTTLREFDPRGALNRTVNDNGHATVATHDALGRLASATDPAGNVETRTYDANGNLATLTRTVAGATGTACPQVCTTRHEHDAEDRLLKTTNPDRTTRTFTYDGRGNVVWVMDDADHVVLHSYDLMDRHLATQRVLGLDTHVTMTAEWDDEGRVKSRCDDAGQCVNYTYVPGTALVATEEPPIGPSVTTAYDEAGNARTLSYSSGKNVTLTYDSLDRLVRTDLAGGSGFSGTTRQEYAYDDAGRVTRATDNGIDNLGIATRTLNPEVIEATQRFDTLGRVVSESQMGLAVAHAFDGVGNVLSTTYPSGTADVGGRVVSRSYDASERLDRVWDSKGLVVDYAHEGGLVARKDLGGPTPSPPATGASFPIARTTVTHDAALRPAGILHQEPDGTVLANLTTRFDAVGNRVAQKLQGSPADPATDQHSQLYALDALDRTTAWMRGPISGSSPSTPLDTISPVLQNASWPHVDGRNNWLVWDPGTGVGPCARTTNATGTPATRQVHDACVSSNTTYRYDVDGNLVSDGEHTFRWDRLNRLVRVEDEAGNRIVAYGYDAFGRRVAKLFPDGVFLPGAQLYKEGSYTYAGQHAIQENLLVESTTPTIGPTTFQVIRQWVYGAGVDEALSMDVDQNNDGIAIGLGDARYHYLYDSADNVLGLVDHDGDLAEGYSYQPYGSVTVLVPDGLATSVRWDGTDAVSTSAYGSDPTQRAHSPAGNVWFFTGRQYDPEVGLYNYRARHYHPTLGQFMSMDPVGPWGDPVSLGNPYVYVGNNPGSWRDPTGMYGWADFWDDAGDFGTAVTAFVPCSCTDWAREDVRASYATFRQRADVPAALKVGAEVFGPPQTRTDAVLALGTAFIPGGAGKASTGAAKFGDDLLRARSGLVRAERGADEVLQAGKSADGGLARQADFLVSPGGDVIPVPQGATGPIPARNGKGFRYEGGTGGGSGLHPDVDGVRVMDPTPPRGPSPGYPHGYVVYMKGDQAVHPYKGIPLPRDDWWRHIPLR